MALRKVFHAAAAVPMLPLVVKPSVIADSVTNGR
jgi:hypothetical protein